MHENVRDLQLEDFNWSSENLKCMASALARALPCHIPNEVSKYSFFLVKGTTSCTAAYTTRSIISELLVGTNTNHARELKLVE